MKTVLPSLTMLAAFACAPTETGNPPLVVETEIMPFVPSGQPGPYIIELRGMPGAVDPADGEVFFHGLLDVALATRADVSTGGSFLVSLMAQGDQRFRVFARNADGVSRPVDYEVMSGRTELLPRGADVCLAVREVVDVGGDGGGSVQIENDCGAEVRLTAEPSTGLTALAPDSLAGGASASLQVQLVAGGPLTIGVIELAVSGATTGTLYITVLATS